MARLLITLFLLFPQAPATRVSMNVRVVKAGTTEPVGRAVIVLARVGGQLGDYQTGTADTSGIFQFRNLTPGSYRIYAEHEGYLRSEYGQQPASPFGTPVAITDGQESTNITIQLTPTGAITGRILDRGKPIRNVWVRALESNYRDGQRYFNMADYALSDDRGEYRVFGLAPGLYFVTASLTLPYIEDDTYVQPSIASNSNNNQALVCTPGATILETGLLDARAVSPEFFATSYHPGTTDPLSAAPVEVRAGSTTSGIDLSLARTSVAHVRGRVLDGRTGEPARNTSVRLISRKPEGGTSTLSNRVENGTFDIAGVSPDSYSLFAQTTVPPLIYVTIPLDVADKDINDLTVVMRPGTTVRGKVTVDGTAPPAEPNSPRLFVQLLGMANLPGYSASPVQPDGTFTVANVDARDYRFRLIQGGRPVYAKSAKFGAEDVLDSPIRVTGDAQDRQLEIVVGLNGGVLEALVVDGNRRPVPGTIVAVVPDTTARRNRSDLYRTSSTDASGRVRIDAIVPGQYKVFASGNVEPGAWQDPDVIGRYESRGEPLQIGEGEKKEMTVRILQ